MAVTASIQKHSNNRQDVSFTTLFSSNRIYICSGLLPKNVRHGDLCILAHSGPLTVTALTYIWTPTWTNRCNFRLESWMQKEEVPCCLQCISNKKP